MCAADGNVTRLQSTDRVGLRSKLTDPLVLQEMREKATLLDPVHDELDVRLMRFHYIELDVTNKLGSKGGRT